MKWFKHFSDASDDEFLAGIEEEFGLEGYARWWKLLEKIASQMDTPGKCSASYSWVKWQSLLKGKRNKLETFLERCENESKLILKRSGNVLEIKCPKLLELQDNYLKKLVQAGKKVPKKFPLEVEVDKKNKSEKISPTPVFSFSDQDKLTAEWMYGKLVQVFPGTKQPSFDNWANQVRLIRVRDKKTDHEIRGLFEWANNDSAFWQGNILSPSKLRIQWDKLIGQRGRGAPSGNGRSSQDEKAIIEKTFARIKDSGFEGIENWPHEIRQLLIKGEKFKDSQGGVALVPEQLEFLETSLQNLEKGVEK